MPHLGSINEHLAAVHVLAIVVVHDIKGPLRVGAVVSSTAVVNLQTTHTAVLSAWVLAANLCLQHDDRIKQAFI